jgi:hypothetical protein
MNCRKRFLRCTLQSHFHKYQEGTNRDSLLQVFLQHYEFRTDLLGRAFSTRSPRVLDNNCLHRTQSNVPPSFDPCIDQPRSTSILQTECHAYLFRMACTLFLDMSRRTHQNMAVVAWDKSFAPRISLQKVTARVSEIPTDSRSCASLCHCNDRKGCDKRTNNVARKRRAGYLLATRGSKQTIRYGAVGVLNAEGNDLCPCSVCLPSDICWTFFTDRPFNTKHRRTHIDTGYGTLSRTAIGNARCVVNDRSTNKYITMVRPVDQLYSVL